MIATHARFDSKPGPREAPVRFSRHDADMLRRVADLVRPVRRERPSVWAKNHVYIPAQASPNRPGWYDASLSPQIPAILDARFDNPGKRGVIIIKPAQIGVSTAMLVQLLSATRTTRGRILYVIGNRDKAETFDTDLFMPMVENSPTLARDFERAQVDARSKMRSRPFPGGAVDFVGAGSASSLMSLSYPEACIDEYEQGLEDFPAKAGSLFEFAKGRQSAPTVRDIAWMSVFSHPRLHMQGIHKLFHELSDQRLATIDCPHCGAAWAPRWAHVKFTRTREDHEPDPESAEFCCPACARAISDDKRRAAARPPSLGGSFRYQSCLADDEAARREWIGLWPHGLLDGGRTVVSFAREYAAVRRDEVALRTWFNLVMGEPFQQTGVIVTPATVREVLAAPRPALLPGGPSGVRLLVAGADVQAPRDNPTIYAAAVAYLHNGVRVLCACERLAGFNALKAWLAGFSVPVGDAGLFSRGQPTGRREIGFSGLGIDENWETGQVLDFCRGSVISAARNAAMVLLPVGFKPHLHADMPSKRASDEKSINPLLPHLGPIKRMELHRHSWVDRVQRAWAEKRVSILGAMPAELEVHMAANVLGPVKTRHTWETARLEWEKVKDAQDDWAMAQVYAEVVAALEFGLDQWAMESIVAQTAEAPPRRDWFRRGGRSGSWLKK